jgi:hypothetical protein
MEKSRRSFLKKLVTGTAAVTAAAAVSPVRVQAGGAKQKSTDEVLYRETPAFRDYYRSLEG